MSARDTMTQGGQFVGKELMRFGEAETKRAWWMEIHEVFNDISL